MPRPQFSLKTMLWLMLALATFLGGIQFERGRRTRADERWREELRIRYDNDLRAEQEKIKHIMVLHGLADRMEGEMPAPPIGQIKGEGQAQSILHR